MKWISVRDRAEKVKNCYPEATFAYKPCSNKFHTQKKKCFIINHLKNHVCKCHGFTFKNESQTFVLLNEGNFFLVLAVAKSSNDHMARNENKNCNGYTISLFKKGQTFFFYTVKKG